MKRPALLRAPLVLLALILPACHHSSTPQAAGPKIPWPVGHPVYDHVVIVVEENKDYEQIIGSAVAPYINALKTEGASFTQMYGEEHHSQGNYFWLFSGSNQGVGYFDIVPDEPITEPNLGEELFRAGRTFKGYSEDLPAAGSTVHKAGLYARKHVPWVSFSNVPKAANVPWKEFPADYTTLPTVSFVIPNLANDMHSGSIATGDAWLKQHLDGYYQWAKQHKSLLIVTFDENNHGPTGLTDPASSDPLKRNRIATLFAGAHIKAGEYAEGKGITHVNVLRTLEAMYGLERAGTQQPYARRAGILDDSIVIDIYSLLP
jgi:phosphatidylinositol-3-phosphatase